MSAIHPTHPLGIPPQDDRHFVGTLHLIGCQSEAPLLPSPPPYDASMHALCKEVAIEKAQEVLPDSKSTSVVKWDTLIAACKDATVKLKASFVDLDKNWFKAYLLKEEKAVIQQQIEAGLAQVQLVQEAAQVLCHEETPAHLLALEAALKGLEAVKPAGSTSFKSPSPSAPIQSERVSRWQQVIQHYLGPIALTGWGLIVQSGILSSDTAKRIPLVGGIIGLCVKIKDSMDTCIEKAKTEDQAGLIAVCELLMETFMSADRIGKAFQETFEAKARHAASMDFIQKATKDQDAFYERINSDRQQFSSDLQQLGSGLQQLGSGIQEIKAMTNQLNSIDVKKLEGPALEVATLESRIAKIEEGQNIIIALLQKQSGAQHVPSQKTVDNAV